MNYDQEFTCEEEEIVLNFSQDCEDLWKLAELAPGRNYQAKLKLEMNNPEKEDTEMNENVKENRKKAQIIITEIGDIKESNRVFCDTYSKIMSNYLA